jgi:lysozyme
MRYRSPLLIMAMVLAPALASTQNGDDADQPPQLLGVWYGEYELETSGKTVQAEMWMGVYWQLSQDGWDIRGHNRWNVLDEPGETKKGPESRGRDFEHFDSFSGHIASDKKTVRISEDHRQTPIEATLVDEDVLHARFQPDDPESPPFTVRLKRIDTEYKPSQAHVLGIDVSHHSGHVDWKQVQEQGYHFAYVKASEGVDNPDAMFEEHWQGLRASGMLRGAYHFYVTEDDPVEQAKFFASRIRDDPGTLPPAVDVELIGAHTTGDLAETLLRFLRTVEQEVGVKPAIYTNALFWDKHYRPEFSDYPLWMAEDGVKMPKVPFGWKNWLFWQRAADKKVKGVEKSVDIDMLHPEIDLQTLRPKE